MLKPRLEKYHFLNVGICICVAFLLQFSCAIAATGVRALDIPAIVVKVPNKVVLIGVTTAGSRLVAVGEHGVIAYSDDNGTSWKQGEVPVDVTLTSVAFANALDGWAVGHYGVILHTKDGGVTWQMQLNGIQANHLTLAAANDAVADHDQAPGAPLALKRANIFVANGPDKPFLSLLVFSPTDVIVFGAYRMAMKTVDGGKTWADWDLHIGDTVSHNLYNATIAPSGIYIVGEAGSVFRSNDGGNIFSMLSAPSDATLLTASPIGQDGLLVCGVSGEAFTSLDRGNSWQPVSFDTQSNLTSSLILKSGEIIVAAEDGNLFASNNGSKAFSHLSPVQPMALYDMTETSKGDLAVAGSSGVYVIPAKDLQQNAAGD